MPFSSKMLFLKNGEKILKNLPELVLRKPTSLPTHHCINEFGEKKCQLNSFISWIIVSVSAEQFSPSFSSPKGSLVS